MIRTQYQTRHITDWFIIVITANISSGSRSCHIPYARAGREQMFIECTTHLHLSSLYGAALRVLETDRYVTGPRNEKSRRSTPRYAVARYLSAREDPCVIQPFEAAHCE